ncbi:MAG: glycosyltransferase family 4 protein [Chloroflexi bacterium]|nr:glycosyltransferase family 4 protein [Chloroflexota bacterium]
MRILIITALYPPATGGAATYFGDIIPLLVQKDTIEKVVVLTESLPDQPQLYKSEGLNILRRLPTRVSVPRRALPWHALSYVRTQLWFWHQLPRLVRKYKIDIIHFHTRYQGRLFYRTLQRCSVPVLADLRDKMSDPEQLTAVSHQLLCCGIGVRHFAIEGGFPAQRINLIPVPFHAPTPLSASALTALRQQYDVEDGRFILFVGDMTFNKGVYELLSAFAQWQTTHPDVKLLMVGTNREGDVFLKRVTAVSNIHFLGHIPHTHVLGLIQAAQMLLLPSRSEGLPRVILEAISLGTKVICPPNIPEFDQTIPQSILPVVEATALATIMEKVWHDTSVPAYPLQNHTVDKVVEELTAVYQNEDKGSL